jgi:DNA invertase Pin-like site-specific DNA recombinase
MLKVGYARTSTLDQQAGFDAQIRDLTDCGCEKIFSEKVSAVGKRPQLEAALDFIREGDTLIVTKLDRLARSTQHLLEIADRVKAKRCARRSWRDPAGESPAQVRGSARLVTSVASGKVTTTAKRTQ